MKNKRFLVPIFLMLVSIGVLIGMKIETAVSGDDIFDNVKKFNEALTIVQRNYVEDVNTEKLTEAAIKGMLEQLDPHSVYMTAEQLRRSNEEFQGSFEGIGVEFDIVNDTILIVAPIAGGPSEALGIMAGDRIVKIDGVSAIGLTRDDVPKKLRGQKGTKVHVTIHRIGMPNLLEFDIIRDKIPLYSIDATFMIDDRTGYTRVTRFAATTHDELTKALSELKNAGMKRLVLDLRGNPGGYLDQAFKIASMFIDKGNKIVYTKSRIGQYTDEYVSTGGEFTDLPLIVLVNEGSASASEIVAGAIQDWDRGLIIGENTFGKGLVQRQYDLSDGSAMRVTTSRYYTPSGRLIQKPYEGSHYKEMVENSELQNKPDADTNRPVFKTAQGRTVYGGGGILPDHVVKIDTLTEYSVQLRRVNMFLEYANLYLSANKDRISSQYGSFIDFARDFQVTEDMLNEFNNLAQSNGIIYNYEQAARDRDFITTSIKSIIARNIWGNNGSMYVWLLNDEQFRRAFELFPEAERLARS